MRKNVFLLILTIVLSIPLWWEINDFQGNYTAQVSQALSQRPRVIVPQKITTEKRKIRKEEHKELKDFHIEAKSALSLKLEGDKEFIIFEKDSLEPLPIASLTKLTTSLVALEIYNPDQDLIISKKAVDQEENIGQLKIGERLSVWNLLHIALMESSNDAAFALAEGILSPSQKIGEKNFVKMMNIEARSIGMENTYFFNPTGLDNNEETNYSTARDLSKLVEYIIKNRPEILKISGKSSFTVYTPQGKIHHIISKNKDKLIGKIPEIIGGKTGYTEMAGGCIITVLENKEGDYLINILLGTKDSNERFIQMERLINAIKENDLW